MIEEKTGMEYISNIKHKLFVGNPVTDQELQDFIEEVVPICNLLNKFGPEYLLVTKELRGYTNKANDCLDARRRLN